MSYTCNNCGKKENPCIFDDTAEGTKPYFCPVNGDQSLTTWKKREAKPAPDPRRYEIAKAALEKLATCKGSWDGVRYSVDTAIVKWIAREALALIDELDKEAAK